jgi:hypothetical protein
MTTRRQVDCIRPNDRQIEEDLAMATIRSNDSSIVLINTLLSRQSGQPS